MTDKTEGLEVVAYLYTLEYGGTAVDSKTSVCQLNYPFGVCGADYLARNDDGVSYVKQTKLCKVESAQAAVAAERKLWEDATLAIKAIGDANADSDCARITELESLVRKVHTAKGRYHTQIAMCDLYDSVGLINERPKK